MKKRSGVNFVVECLDKSHCRTEFSCGDEALDKYIQQHASQDQKKKITAPFVLVDLDNDVLAGFYTLSMKSVYLSSLPDEIKKSLPRYPDIPAALLGRLAVDANYRGNNLGEYLLMDAMKKCLDNDIMAYCLIVDAYEDAVSFYVKYGFMELPGHENRLFLPMKTIEKLFK